VVPQPAIIFIIAKRVFIQGRRKQGMQLYRLIIRNTFVVLLLCLIGGIVADAKTNLEIPAPNQGDPPMTVNCNASPDFVTRGSGSSVVTMTAHARNAENNVITYRWNASGGATISGSGSRVTVDTADLAPGKYTVTVTVGFSHGHTTTCSTTVNVVEKIGPDCPVISSLVVEPRTVEAGTNIKVTFHVSSSYSDDDSTKYLWSTSSGTLSGSGDTVTLDTTGMRAGSVRVSVTVSDGKCQGDDSATLTIKPKPQEVMPWQLASCNTYKRLNDTRPDNTCKGFLDDAATKLQRNPGEVLLIRSYSEKKEKANTDQLRAERVRDYLVSKGIDSSRIKIKAMGTKAAPDTWKDNNKIVMMWLAPKELIEPQ